MLRALLLSALAASSSASASAASAWPRILLTDYATSPLHAVALDGSPAALYVRPGSSSDFLLFFEGGGWCESPEDCLARSKTPLGSSKFLSSGYAARDLLQTDCNTNPAFCNHSFVYAQYLDGASRAGSVAEPVQVGNETIFFRGHAILQATLAALLAPGGVGSGMPSLAGASKLLISGSSAGGLTTFLHADEISELVHAANPGCEVRAVPEVGFFIDGESIWSRQHIMTSVYARIAAFANVSSSVNAGCAASKPVSEQWQCFMAQYTLPHIKTPLFLVNSMVDEWQAQNILAPNTITEPAVSTYGAFKPCILDPVAGCNATQAAQWTGFAGQFLAALEAAKAATPAPQAALHGGIVTSCPIHTTMIGGLSHRIKVGGVSLYEAVSAWVAGKGQQWTVDVPFPGNPTCPKPAAAGEDVELM
jgi:hypothetical protein